MDTDRTVSRTEYLAHIVKNDARMLEEVADELENRTGLTPDVIRDYARTSAGVADAVLAQSSGSTDQGERGLTGTHNGRPNDPIPTTGADREPRGFLPGGPQRELILAELAAAGVELGEYDRRIVDWLANADYGTAATVLGWVKRASA